MIPPFELDTLKRNWIEGVAGADFCCQVRGYIQEIEAIIDLSRERGVLISHSDPVEFAAALLASIHSGVPTILANPKWQQSEWEQLGEQVNPAIIFGMSAVGKARMLKPSNLKPRDILIPTGGSSGKMKLTVHSWSTLTAACEGFSAFFGAESVDLCCVLPLYHVSGLMQLIRSFTSKGQIVFTNYRALQNGEIPEINAQNLCLSLVPTQLERLIKHADISDWLCSLRAIFMGGAPMSSNLQTRARKLRLPVVLTYGMTETAAMITALPSNDFLSGKSGVGYALKHAKIRVINKNGSTCLPEEVGVIQIEARSLCLGYYGLSSSSSESSYRSQDEGYLDHEGGLHLVGRSDRIIISGGEKIDPLEVEKAFLETGTVGQVFAMGWPDSDWGEQLVVFCVSSNSMDDVETLREHLKNKLVNYKIPREIIFVSELPLTLNGKPDRVLIHKLLKK